MMHAGGRAHLLAGLCLCSFFTLSFSIPSDNHEDSNQTSANTTAAGVLNASISQNNITTGLGSIPLSNIGDELETADKLMKSQERDAVVYNVKFELDPPADPWSGSGLTIESSLLSYFVKPSRLYHVEKGSEGASRWKIYDIHNRDTGIIRPFDLTFMWRLSLADAYAIAWQQRYVSWFQEVVIERDDDALLPHYKFIRTQWDRYRSCVVDVGTQQVECTSRKLNGEVQVSSEMSSNSTDSITEVNERR